MAPSGRDLQWVVLSTPAEYMHVMHYELLSRQDVHYIADIEVQQDRLFRRVLAKAAKPVAPLKVTWFRGARHPLDLGLDIPYDSPVIFLVYEYNPLAQEPHFLRYLRGVYPNSRLVHIYTNTVDHHGPQRLDFARRWYDLVVSFDATDAKQYGLAYHPTVYSKMPVLEPGGDSSDVFFVGVNKGRSALLRAVFERLITNGFRCDFTILDVPPKERFYLDSINYHNRLAYSEVLERVQRTRVVLEVLKPGQVGPSLRANEALIYGKRLLSNSQAHILLSQYHEGLVSFFSDADSIDLDFIRMDDQFIRSSRDAESLLSPQRLLSFIQSALGAA